MILAGGIHFYMFDNTVLNNTRRVRVWGCLVYAVRLKEALHYLRKPPLIMTLIELLCCLYTVSQLAKKRRHVHDCPTLLSATVLLQHCPKALSHTQFLYVFLGKWETDVAIY